MTRARPEVTGDDPVLSATASGGGAAAGSAAGRLSGWGRRLVMADEPTGAGTTRHRDPGPVSGVPGALGTGF
ncbi:hypothetical protein CT688_15295 [Dietzia sp. JS16-p6b]|nr:hypothetical protein CT688_15295 [Dietzia sp. JS16-p6b]